MGSRCGHIGSHLRHPSLFRNHAENHWRHLCGPACHRSRLHPHPLLRFFYPAVWFINLFASLLLKVLHLSPKPGAEASQLSPEELHSLVLESSHLIPQKHHAILSSLFELNNITVEDVMTPRGKIEILNLEQPWEDVKNQLATSHHSRLPTCRESLDQLVGVLPVRRLLASLGDPDFDLAALLEQLQPPTTFRPKLLFSRNWLSFRKTASGSALWSTSTVTSSDY